jgi:hypothetical protein
MVMSVSHTNLEHGICEDIASVEQEIFADVEEVSLSV